MNQNVAAYLPGLAHPTPSEKTENYTVTSGQGGHWNHHFPLHGVAGRMKCAWTGSHSVVLVNGGFKRVLSPLRGIYYCPVGAAPHQD